MATVRSFNSPFTTISEWKYDPATNTGRYEPKTFVAGMEQDPMKRYAQAAAAKGDKTVWDEASKTYKQAPVLSKSEFDKTDPYNQMMGNQLAYSNAVLGAQGGGTMMSGTNLAKLDASLGTLRKQLLPGVGKSEGQSTGQQQGASAQSSQGGGGGGGGVSGIDFVWSGGNAGTRVGTPSGRQGTMDPLYDPKYRFWDKGIPSKFYDPVDPSKPISFPEQTRREREARARWIGAMSDQEYSFYRRSLGQGAGSSGQDADAMRQAAKNPPAPKEEYGDPMKGQPGPIGLRGEAANSKAAPTNYMGGSNTFNESTGTRMENIKLGSGTGLGKPSLVKLPATPVQTSVVDRKMRTKKARPNLRFFS